MKKQPNLIVFGLESLRRDHMSLYGYPRLTSPHITKYAGQGVTFNQCFSPSIPTTPGYSSMLTGRDCFGTNVVALRHQGAIADGVPTLAEMLKAQGYNTTCVGFGGNPASRGFDNYLEFPGWGSFAEGRSPKAENLNAVTLPEMDRLTQDDQPFFLFLRHMDPHSPYLAPEPFAGMFYQGDENNPANTSLDPVFNFKPFCDFFATWFPPKCTDKDYIIAQYDAEIAYMDACIVPLMQKVVDLGLDEDTLIVFTSDHGETLYDHDCYFDHHGIYECTLSVPLAFRFPGKIPAGLKFNDIVQLKDITPTLLSVMGIDAGVTFDGRDLSKLWQGGAIEQQPEMYITECTWMRKHGWRTPEWKLMVALEPDFHFKPEVELYNLVKDPGELNNVAEACPEVVTYLKARMEAHIAARETAVGRENPMYNNLTWHGVPGIGAFESSEQAYNTLHIGDVNAAKRLQEGKKS